MLINKRSCCERLLNTHDATATQPYFQIHSYDGLKNHQTSKSNCVNPCYAC